MFRVIILGLGAVVILGCAKKERFTKPYCYLKPVSSAIDTLKPAREACPQKDRLEKEACMSAYISTRESIKDAVKSINNLVKEDIKPHHRKYYADLLKKSLSTMKCSFFEDCPKEKAWLVKDCDHASPNVSVK